jgi:hypothetical protein
MSPLSLALIRSVELTNEVFRTKGDEDVSLDGGQVKNQETGHITCHKAGHLLLASCQSARE